jgi:hypothetical protein
MGDLAIQTDKPVIVPIVSPQIHWDTFLLEVRRGTGDSLTRSMDQCEVRPKSDQSIVAALAQFRQSGFVEPHKAVREANAELRFLHFSFFCIFDPSVFHDISLETEISVIRHHSNPKACVLGGSLFEWKPGIIELSDRMFPFLTRYFANFLLLAFQCNGYSQVWEGWEKRTLPDQTFTLEMKRGD